MQPTWGECAEKNCSLVNDCVRRSAFGKIVRVSSIEIRAGPETVYGLEVAGEHVYQIADAGLLVHNASASGRGELSAPMGVKAYRTAGKNYVSDVTMFSSAKEKSIHLHQQDILETLVVFIT
ncbi:MAG: hypothetical protein NXI29_27300 [bacterium]|nr:hypothetical protein [bacterium]